MIDLKQIILLIGIGLGLLLILVLVFKILYIYQTWVNRKMYELGEKVHDNIFLKEKNQTK